MTEMLPSHDFNAAPAAPPPRAAGFYGVLPPNLWHTLAVHNFISAFFTPYEETPHPRPPETAYVANKAFEVLKEIHDFWFEHGWTPLPKLIDHLLDKTAPDVAISERERLKADLTDEIREPENLTGFTRKAYGPMQLGLMHLFAMHTNKPVGVLSADFSNIGGLMKHLEGLLCRETEEKYPEDEAYDLADAVIQVCTGLARQNVEQAVGDSQKVLAIRSGGDEFDFAVVGLTADVLPHLRSSIYKDIETFLASAGLMGFGYHKDALYQDFRGGTGMGIGIASLDQGTDPGHLVHSLEEQTTREKYTLGEMRTGRLTPQVLPAGLEGRAREEYVLRQSLATGLLPRHYDSIEQAQAETNLCPDTRELDLGDARYRSARRAFKELEGARLTAAGKVRASLPEGAEQDERAKAGLLLGQLRAALADRQYRGFLRPKTEYQNAGRLSDSLGYHDAVTHRVNKLKSFSRAGADYDSLLRRIVRAFEPIDPGTGLLMEDSLSAHIGRYAALDRPNKPSHLLMVEFEGLRTLNEFSHAHADHARAKIGQIVEGALAARGITREWYVGASKGARITYLLPPRKILPPDQQTWNQDSIPITHADYRAIKAQIAAGVLTLNKLTLGEFFSDMKEPLALPEGADPRKRIGDLVDPRRSSTIGLNALSRLYPVSRGQSGGDILKRVRKKIEQAVDRARTARQKPLPPLDLYPEDRPRRRGKRGKGPQLG